MDNRRIEELYKIYMAGQANAAEKQELLSLWNDPNNEARIKALMDLYFDEGAIEYLQPDHRAENIFLDITTDLKSEVADQSYTSPTHRIHFLKASWFKYAAVVILVFGAGTYWWFNNKKMNAVQVTQPIADIAPGSERAMLTLANGKQIMLNGTQGTIVKQGDLNVTNLNGKLDYEGKGNAPEYHTLSTPRGGQYKVQLPDGTNAWLNAASSITYPTVFAGKKREVKISGEIYFEIAKNANQPFIVTANNVAVNVLGTHFNVNAYPNEAGIATTLLEGSVQVVNGRKEQLLQPNEQAIALNDQLRVKKVNVNEVIAWKNGFFNFNEADLPTVMRELERWYDIEVKYDGKITNKTFLGELPRDLSLAQIIKVLDDVNIKFRREGRTLILK